MKVLVVGGGGMLGHKLVQIFGRYFDVFATLHGAKDSYDRFGIFEPAKSFDRIDVEDIDDLEIILSSVRPDVVVNAVGLVKQLPNSANIVETLNVNSIFPHRLAQVARKYGTRLISISTDCVFSGEKGNYKETDVPDAVDLYGRSKSLGEVTDDGCLTIRTSMVGREIGPAHSLVEWFLGNAGGTVKGYTEAIFSGFPTIVLTEILATVIRDHPQLTGLYHISSEPISKYDLLQLIKSSYDIDIEIEPSTDLKIDRSLNSDRFRDETNFSPAGWPEMIEQMTADPTKYAEYL